MGRETVIKSYQVVTLRAQLSANEQNILTLLVLELKKQATNIREDIKRDYKSKNSPIPKDNEINISLEKIPTKFEFDLSELTEAMGVSSSALSRTLYDTTDKLIKRKVIWSLPNKNWAKAPLVSYANYANGRLRIDLHEQTSSAILDETRGFSVVDLKLSMSLRGGYDKRILDMISRDKESFFTTSFNSFQDMIGTTIEDYSRGLAGFRKVVLDEPLKRIFAASDGVWGPVDEKGKGYELIKEGRTVKKIIFKVKYTDPDALKETKDLFLSEQSNLDVDTPVKQPYEYTLPGMEDKIRTFTKMSDVVMMHLIAYEATAKNEGYRIPAEIVARIKMLRK